MNATRTCINCDKRSECFKNLIPSELEFITQKKVQITYQKGEIICKQGTHASSVIYIAEGLAKLYLENTNHKFTNIEILQASDFIGLTSIFGENTYDYTVVAIKKTEVCHINKKSIRKLIRKNAEFASEIIKRFCVREKHLFNLIHSISYKQMPGRLADALIELSSEENNTDDLFPYISRKDIADFACISKESTIKLLTEFKNEGIISVNGKDIEIIKPEKLFEISKLG